MRRYSETLWSIELRDDKGTRYMPVYGGIVTAKTIFDGEIASWTDPRPHP